MGACSCQQMATRVSAALVTPEVQGAHPHWGPLPAAPLSGFALSLLPLFSEDRRANISDDVTALCQRSSRILSVHLHTVKISLK